MLHPIAHPWRKPAFAGGADVAQWSGANARSRHVIATPLSGHPLVVHFDDSAWSPLVRPAPVPALAEPDGAAFNVAAAFKVEPEFEPEFVHDAEPSEADTAAVATEVEQRCASRSLDDGALCTLIGRIGHHDDKALAALYDATSPRVFGLVGRIVGDPALAEEVVEDTYWQVWRQALRFDAGRGRPLTWLLAMARSRAIDALRRRERKAHVALDEEEQAALCDEQNAGPPDLLAATRSEHLLHQALAALDVQPRQLIALAFFRGLTHEEIANCTCLPLGTVKSQIRRSLQALRQHLADAGCVDLPW